jgi:preprotein translocase subunit SecE
MVPAKEWIPRIQKFWHETRAEMKKVAWPSQKEVVGTTGMVVGATVFFGVYLWVCDLAFYKAIEFLFKQFGVTT